MYKDVVVVNREHYNISAEQYNDVIALHSKVSKWSKSIRQAYLKDFYTLVQLINNNVYTYINPNDKKLRKFVEMLGFRFLRSMNGLYYFIRGK